VSYGVYQCFEGPVLFRNVGIQLLSNAMKAVCPFERPETDYPVTRRHIPVELSPQPYRRDKRKIRVRT
jgi:hypothetical protein